MESKNWWESFAAFAAAAKAAKMSEAEALALAKALNLPRKA